jgi:hypothetical protein
MLYVKKILYFIKDIYRYFDCTSLVWYCTSLYTCIHVETTMHERYRIRWVSNSVTPLLISTCSVLHARQNSNMYTLVLHRVATKFVIWLRKWCDMYTCMKKEDTLFTKYRPTRGMNIHIYNYLKYNICLTKTEIQLHILITCHVYAQCGWYV